MSKFEQLLNELYASLPHFATYHGTTNSPLWQPAVYDYDQHIEDRNDKLLAEYDEWTHDFLEKELERLRSTPGEIIDAEFEDLPY